MSRAPGRGRGAQAASSGAVIGVLAVDHGACLAVAARLAAPLLAGLADLAATSSCGRPEGLPRGVTALPPPAFRPQRPFTGPLFAALESLALVARWSQRPDATRSRPALGLVVPLVRLDAARAPDPVRKPTGREWAADRADGSAAALAGPSPGAAPVVVTDHVQLSGCGPLAGHWPAGRPRTFPSMNGVYAPAVAQDLLDRAGGGDLMRPPGAALRASARPASRPPCPAAPTSGAASRPTAATQSSAGPPSTAGAAEREPDDGRSAAGAAVYSRLAVAGVADTSRLSVFEAEQARAAGLTVASSCLVAPVVIAAYYGLAVAAVGVPVR